MNKTAKSLLIPVAAFAVTATGVSAFNSEVLEKAGLTETQIEAFAEARELREDGDKDAARDVLEAAGINMATMQAIRQAHQTERQTYKAALAAAVEENDYAAFQVAVAGSPLADIVNTEADFTLFVEAHNLRQQADEIMTELGFEPGMANKAMHGRHHGMLFGHEHDD